MKRFLMSALIVIQFSGLNYAKNQSSPNIYNLEMPFLKISDIKTPQLNPPFYQSFKTIFAVLDIDKKGNVVRVLPQNESELNFVKYFEQNLLSLKFEPAKKENKKIDFKLPVKLLFVPDQKIPKIFFPIDSNYQIINSLFEDAYELNGFVLSKLLEYPSFFSDVDLTDSLSYYKYSLIQVKLDEKGNVIETNPVKSTLSAFDMQLSSGCLWGKFSPMTIKNKPVASTSYLLVSFFPHLHYPTQKWELEKLTGKKLYQRISLRLLPDTIGLLSPPVPYFFPPETNYIDKKAGNIQDSIVCLVTVNNNGKILMNRFGTQKKQVRQAILKMLANMRMFPAMTFKDELIDFQGLISFIIEGSGIVRIQYHWLD